MVEKMPPPIGNRHVRGVLLEAVTAGLPLLVFLVAPVAANLDLWDAWIVIVALFLVATSCLRLGLARGRDIAEALMLQDADAHLSAANARMAKIVGPSKPSDEDQLLSN